MLYENDNYTVGTALVDPGCQEHLFQDIYEKYMLDTSSSNLCVSGFDGSTQPGRLQGWSHLYFLPRADYVSDIKDGVLPPCAPELGRWTVTFKPDDRDTPQRVS